MATNLFVREAIKGQPSTTVGGTGWKGDMDIVVKGFTHSAGVCQQKNLLLEPWWEFPLPKPMEGSSECTTYTPQR